jgi:hypothetical protein
MKALEKNSPSPLKRNPEEIVIELTKIEAGQETKEQIDLWVSIDEDPEFVAQQIRECVPSLEELAMEYYHSLTAKISLES